ncbi:DUF1722 domain-containing protein [Salinicoccus roseus]|uniref:DUF1722 domain-containing protein n=1 Tax=Salinicoccus roseus TaxID=45670 RepID=UPI0014739174|nr:DUF1722 domain-containing protein [Salinicoccus roseus]GGA72118.1 hypothetical protein GCM10007176_15360 [Salinicoccus roseus]
MKTSADVIIDLIERFNVHDPGARRAHGNGDHHEAAVYLNEEGREIFGGVTKATVRLSNAATSEKMPDELVNIKGCSVRFHHRLRPIDIIGVNFPYFPLGTAAEVTSVMLNIGVYLNDKSAGRFFSIFRPGRLYRDLDTILKWLPKRTDMDYKYYTAQSYGEDPFKFRLDYDPQTSNIELYAEKDAHVTEYQPEGEMHLGHISVDQEPAGQEIKFMDTMNAPFGRDPNGEIPLLRHFLYRRSFLGRMEEAELDQEKFRMLEELWREEELFVLMKSPELHDQVRSLFESGIRMSVSEFRRLLDQAYDMEYEPGSIRNYMETVWGHFKDEADDGERTRYQELQGTSDIDEIHTFIGEMALKYEVPELLDSIVVKVLGRREVQRVQKGRI